MSSGVAKWADIRKAQFFFRVLVSFSSGRGYSASCQSSPFLNFLNTTLRGGGRGIRFHLDTWSLLFIAKYFSLAVLCVNVICQNYGQEITTISHVSTFIVMG